MFTPLLAIGLASTIFQILFALSVHRLRLILFSLAASMLFLVQYTMVGQWVGLYSGIAGSTYTLLLALGYRWPRLQHRSLTYVFAAAYLAIFLLANDWAHPNVFEVIPLVAGVAMLFALHTKNLIITKAVMLTAGILWLAFEGYNTMYTQMIGEAFEFVGNLIALITLARAARRGIPRRELRNLDEELVDVLTGAIHLPQHTTGADTAAVRVQDHQQA